MHALKKTDITADGYRKEKGTDSEFNHTVSEQSWIFRTFLYEMDMRICHNNRESDGKSADCGFKVKCDIRDII